MTDGEPGVVEAGIGQAVPEWEERFFFEVAVGSVCHGIIHDRGVLKKDKEEKTGEISTEVLEESFCDIYSYQYDREINFVNQYPNEIV